MGDGKNAPGVFANATVPDRSVKTEEPAVAGDKNTAQSSGVSAGVLAGWAAPILAVVAAVALWSVSPLLVAVVFGGLVLVGLVGFVARRTAPVRAVRRLAKAGRPVTVRPAGQRGPLPGGGSPGRSTRGGGSFAGSRGGGVFGRSGSRGGGAAGRGAGSGSSGLFGRTGSGAGSRGSGSGRQAKPGGSPTGATPGGPRASGAASSSTGRRMPWNRDKAAQPGGTGGSQRAARGSGAGGSRPGRLSGGGKGSPGGATPRGGSRGTGGGTRRGGRTGAGAGGPWPFTGKHTPTGGGSSRRRSTSKAPRGGKKPQNQDWKEWWFGKNPPATPPEPKATKAAGGAGKSGDQGETAAGKVTKPGLVTKLRGRRNTEPPADDEGFPLVKAPKPPLRDRVRRRKPTPPPGAQKPGPSGKRADLDVDDAGFPTGPPPPTAHPEKKRQRTADVDDAGFPVSTPRSATPAPRKNAPPASPPSEPVTRENGRNTTMAHNNSQDASTTQTQVAVEIHSAEDARRSGDWFMGRAQQLRADAGRMTGRRGMAAARQAKLLEANRAEQTAQQRYGMARAFEEVARNTAASDSA